MCVCDLSFKCVCAIWEWYILNPPARGWSSPSRRPLPLFNMSSRPAVLPSCRHPVLPAVVSCRVLSSCRHRNRLASGLSCRPVVIVCPVAYCRRLSSGVWRMAYGAWSSGCLVIWLPGQLVILSRLCAFHLRAHLSRNPAFPIHSLKNLYQCGECQS